jgi:hypothetical protein
MLSVICNLNNSSARISIDDQTLKVYAGFWQLYRAVFRKAALTA